MRIGRLEWAPRGKSLPYNPDWTSGPRPLLPPGYGRSLRWAEDEVRALKKENTKLRAEVARLRKGRDER